jgi:hypothetical protein
MKWRKNGPPLLTARGHPSKQVSRQASKQASKQVKQTRKHRPVNQPPSSFDDDLVCAILVLVTVQYSRVVHTKSEEGMVINGYPYK